MNSLFKKFLATRSMEFLTLDRDLIVLETSEGVQRFAEDPQEFRAGKDVRLGFPELIGSENYLMAVFEGQRSIFEFVSLGRGDNNSLYFNLYVILQEKSEVNADTLIIFLEDVTERIILEQSLVQATNSTNLLVSALSASKDYIDKIINSMADAMLVTTTSGTIKTVNKAAEELFGYSELELSGQPISIIIDDKNFLKQANQQHPLFQKNLKNIEVVCQSKTGKKISVAFSCSVIQTDVQDLQNFVYIGRDITQRKRVQQRQVAQYATTRVLSESTTLNKAIQKILPALCESLSWDVGEFWMVEEGSGERGSLEAGFIDNISRQQTPLINPPSFDPQLRCVESWTRALVGIKEFISTKKITFALGVGLPGRVWASRSR